jgi:glycosyltransferase involved in cell wall biosynthesis
MVGPTVTAVVLAHDRRAFVADAVRSALAAAPEEVIVVRNFSDPIVGSEGTYRDVRCDVPETAEKHARGIEAATGDLIAFLDDDDLWDPRKVARLRQVWSDRSDLAYLAHAQRAVDAEGRPVAALHPEYAGRDPGGFATWDRTDFRTLAERIWPGNGSSTVVAREFARTWLAPLRQAGWSADTFWLVAAVLSGRPMTMLDEPLTQLRLHRENMSHARAASPDEFRARHRRQSERFARAFEAMTELAVARAGPAASISSYLRAKGVDFRFFAELEAGHRPRRAALRALREGRGAGDPGAYRAALATLVAPSLARKLLYRSHTRRWEIS